MYSKRFLRVIRAASTCIAISGLFPVSMYLLWKHLGLKEANYSKFVVCTKCFSLYKYDDCILKVEGKLQSERCSHIQYPNQSQLAHRKACGNILIKTVTLSGGKEVLYPYKTYCYKPIKETLKQFLKRPHYESRFEEWKNRETLQGGYWYDYDGTIWKEFQQPDKNSFLSHPRHYGLMDNLNWFQPFDYVQYSVGVTHAVVLNLPRQEH